MLKSVEQIQQTQTKSSQLEKKLTNEFQSEKKKKQKSNVKLQKTDTQTNQSC